MGSLGDEPQELADIVWGLCRTNGPGFGNREFLPASTYKDHDLLNENVLRAELGILPGEDDPLVQFILGFATKIFLALLSRAWDIDTTRDFLKNFMKTGFMDEMLPVNLEFCNSSPSFRSKGWTLGRRKNFCDSQWLHLAPVISETTFTFNLEPRQPLPFFTAGESSQEIGGSCLVHRVQIHEDHLFNPPRDRSNNPFNIAVKEIPEASHSQFTTEATALLAARPLNHPHIIPCLAAITQAPSHYLLFPWATGGSLLTLQHYLDPLSLPLPDLRLLISQTLHQFRGILDALSHLHSMGFRHGDIKPDNILRFHEAHEEGGSLQDESGVPLIMQVGTWKLADFGLAKKHKTATVRRGPTETRCTTVRYEPPETEKAMNGEGSMSRLGDIWSLGAVMLECVIWLMYGDGEVERFAKEMGGGNVRGVSFYVMGGHGEVRLNDVVVEWIEHMKTDEEGQDTALGELLAVAEKYMLTSGALRDDWDVECKVVGQGLMQGTRATSKELLVLLDKIIGGTKRTIMDDEYLFKGEWMVNGRGRSGGRGPRHDPAGRLPDRPSSAPL